MKRRIIVMADESTSEPAHPRRFEKKRGSEMTHKRRSASRVLVLVAMLMVAAPAFAQEYTLKLNGINGSSQVVAGAMDIQSFSWGVSNPAAMNRTDLTAGKPTASEFAFTMMGLKELPLVFLKIVGGESISDAQFTISVINQSSGKLDKLMDMKFDGVMLTSLQLAGSDNNGLPFHQVSMSFMAVEICVPPTTVNPCRKFNFAELK